MQEKKEEDLRQVSNKVYEGGMDEVGRGAIFGPVFSAVVVLTEENKINEVIFTEEKDEIEVTDDLKNARKKRRRSSASIE